jgi:hypothetical protein
MVLPVLPGAELQDNEAQVMLMCTIAETGVIDLGPKYQERFAIDGKGVTTVFRFEMRQLLRAELHAERGESAIKAIGIRFTFNSSMSAKQRLARCQIWNMTIHCL